MFNSYISHTQINIDCTIICFNVYIDITFQEYSLHNILLSEGHIIRNPSGRESALDIKLRTVHIQEFGQLSQDNMVELIDYLTEIQSGKEVSFYEVVQCFTHYIKKIS